MERIRIAMITEFFYPRLGGVETHIWSICQSLLQKGYHVIVITRSDEGFVGRRSLANGVVVYYLPLQNMVMGTIIPLFYTWLPVLRNILQNEKITIVHYHQCTSVMMHTSIRFCELLGLRTVYTDHSIMNLNDMEGIAINQVFRGFACNMDAFVCVSHCDRDNLFYRLYYPDLPSIPPNNIYVIPNAVDTARFLQDFSRHPITTRVESILSPTRREMQVKPVIIVILSRLVYRKGVQLMVSVIERLMRDTQNCIVLIGGDGNKRYLLDNLAGKWNRFYHTPRVVLLGEIPYDDVPAFLSLGDIFLSCSLTESFNITILEAYISGCSIVSTRVGGVAEVLPADRGIYKAPSADALYEGVQEAIKKRSHYLHHFCSMNKEDDELLRLYSPTTTLQ